MKKIQVDTLIIGAGVVGSSVAMHLAKLGAGSIRVVDFDLEGSLSSSELNAGGVRATWNQPINIELSKMTLEYFATVQNQVGYRDCGYLWLHTSEKWTSALQSRERQVQRGWPVEIWDISTLQQRVPFIDKVSDLAGALFAPRDGLINPNLLKNHFRKVAQSAGVVFDDRTWVRVAEYSSNSEFPIQIAAERFESVLSYQTKLETLSRTELPAQRSNCYYEAKQVINCAGPWAKEVAKILGYHCPSYPLRRQISLFACRELDLNPYGMIIDPSGVYFHPEATSILAGFATPHEIPGANFSYDGESFFNEQIWPALFERSSYFEKLKHVTGWAGLYDMSPDESGILGSVDYGGVPMKSCVYEGHSFSGHGVMQSYGVGLLLAEKMMHGRYQSLDAEILAGHRFERNCLVHENWVI